MDDAIAAPAGLAGLPTTVLQDVLLRLDDPSAARASCRGLAAAMDLDRPDGVALIRAWYVRTGPAYMYTRMVHIMRAQHAGAMQAALEATATADLAEEVAPAMQRVATDLQYDLRCDDGYGVGWGWVRAAVRHGRADALRCFADRVFTYDALRDDDTVCQLLQEAVRLADAGGRPDAARSLRATWTEYARTPGFLAREACRRGDAEGLRAAAAAAAGRPLPVDSALRVAAAAGRDDIVRAVLQNENGAVLTVRGEALDGALTDALEAGRLSTARLLVGAGVALTSSVSWVALQALDGDAELTRAWLATPLAASIAWNRSLNIIYGRAIAAGAMRVADAILESGRLW